MMNTMKAGSEVFPGWSKEDVQRHIGFMIGFCKELGEAGQLVSAEGLSFPEQAKLVRAAEDGTPITRKISGVEGISGGRLDRRCPDPRGRLMR